jgi:hypothetical protein
MSRQKSNVNLNKTAGHEAQGRDVIHSDREEAYSQSIVAETEEGQEASSGDARAFNTPPNPAEEQTSTKSGKRSSSQKLASVRHANTPTPAAKSVAGAFGREDRHGQRKAAPRKTLRRRKP